MRDPTFAFARNGVSLGRTADNLTDGDGYQVTNSAGNLVDTFGNEMDGDYVTGPGFPGFGGITAAQSLAYAAEMQDAGVQILYLGLNGNGAGAGPNSAGSTSGGPALVSSEVNPGIWMDHTDAQPTLMSLVGLKDDYIPDGRVLTELMTNPPATAQDPNFLPLATCYKQLNSSVGEFGSDTLAADTQAIESGSTSNDSSYTSFSSRLSSLGGQRDTLATSIKNELYNAEFNGVALPSSASGDLTQCNAIVADAAALLGGPGTGTPESPLPILLPVLAIGVAGVGLYWRRRRHTRQSIAS